MKANNWFVDVVKAKILAVDIVKYMYPPPSDTIGIVMYDTNVSGLFKFVSVLLIDIGAIDTSVSDCSASVAVDTTCITVVDTKVTGCCTLLTT